MAGSDTIAGKAIITQFRIETVSVGGIRLHHWIGGPADGPPVLLLHGFLSTSYAWRQVTPLLAAAGCSVLVQDLRGFGDSDKPAGDAGYNARAMAEELRALVAALGFGNGRPIVVAAHDMGAPPALVWAADHPAEVAGLAYVEAPVMLVEVLRPMLAYTPEAMAEGSLWWWILPLAPGVPDRLIVGNERAFLTWFYERASAHPEVFGARRRVPPHLRRALGRARCSRRLPRRLRQHRAVGAADKAQGDDARRRARRRQGAGRQGRRWRSPGRRRRDREDAARCGHFVPEEAPDAVVRHVLALAHTQT